MRRNSKARIIINTDRAATPDTIIVGESVSHYTALRTTARGYVYISAVRWEGGTEATYLFFVWQGREYSRRFDKFYGLKWATRLAEEFVRDVVGECGE